MVREEARSRLEDLARYEKAVAAEKFKGEKNSSLARTALRMHVEGLGLDEGSRDIVDRYISNEKGLNEAIDIYAGKWNEAFGSLTINEAQNYMGESVYSGLDDRDKSSIKSEVAKFKDEKIGDIEKKLGKALYLLQGVQGELVDATQDQIDKAKNTKRDYENILPIVNTWKSYRIEGLRKGISDENIKENLQERAKKIRGEE